MTDRTLPRLHLPDATFSHDPTSSPIPEVFVCGVKMSGKRAYKTPTLVSLGTVKSLTLGGRSNPSPDGATSRKNGP